MKLLAVKLKFQRILADILKNSVAGLSFSIFYRWMLMVMISSTVSFSSTG